LINRRNFIQKSLGGALAFATALLNPFPRVSAQALDTIDSDYVSKTRAGKFKNFYINFWKTMRRIRPETWTLLSDGLCNNSRRFTLEELKSLPSITQKSRLKCVECWSAKAEWQGFHFSEFAKLTQPHPDANGAVFYCGDNYIEHLSIETLRQERVLFAYNMNQAPLSDEHGFPLRLIVPFKYGYKNPKSILRIEWVNDVRYGTWSKIGPYSPDGTILPGYDHPLDQNKKRRRITGGEIPY
jgi:sulfoxide reductase catalytic subunit YedY